jgi:ABC-type transport system involved in resistance to organic solvents, periplasmic component
MKTSQKVGIFVLLVSILTGYLIIKFSGKELGQSFKTYYVYFDDAQGLSKGADVQVLGVKAGRVEDISFENGKVKAILKIKKEIPLYKNATVSIRTYGLMGDKYIYINPGSPNTGNLAENQVIKSGKNCFNGRDDKSNQRCSAKIRSA